MIEVSNLSKRYRLGSIGATSLREEFTRTWNRLRGVPYPDKTEFWALRDVSFSVQPGAVVGIIGRNGAGKSTLLKILSRITEPTIGSARLRGRVASLLEVGTGFHPELTGRENIYLNGAILGMSRAEVRRKFDEIVAFAEVERFIDTPVKRYSSGMYVRLAFAVAAHLEPEILIIDEVLAVGDAAFQKKCLGRMHTVAEQHGRTVLFVSHNLGAVRSLCTNCLWLESGTLRQQGPTDAVVNDYYKAGSLAPASLNIALEPRLGHHGEQLRITALTLNRNQPILHGEPFSFAIDFEARSACEEVSFGLGLANLDGTRLMSMDSDLTTPRFTLKAGQRGRVECTLDRLLIQPGLYLVDLGARSGDFNGLDYLSGIMRLEVLPGPSTPSTLIRDSGHVRYPGGWSIASA
ncbi:MAG: ABC transporter ATP-binding protein [Verrucomicrobia bacterium]|nr:ABC transporter ATP-binding protein [Verrucomicrobiota bacterium]